VAYAPLRPLLATTGCGNLDFLRTVASGLNKYYKG